ncbi:MAG: fibrillarin-like pre-rRNA processing protein [Candidatus Woesearchaeota archaeon]|nr:fibrillarin-like pre-rRNA processing protein [Candidatus Woesearchaeota archaeon]
MEQFKHFNGVYSKRRGNSFVLYTKSPYGGESHYGEKIIKEGKSFYREWNPERSKLSAALHKGISQIAIKQAKRVLYLGAASGTTVSHVSDIVGKQGKVFAVEFSPSVVVPLYFLAKKRDNIVPILADARHPESYALFSGQCDIVYQDIAQKDQVDIFLKNIYFFLPSSGFGILCVKARSIDVSKNSKEVFDDVEKELLKKTVIVDKRELAPFEKDHKLFIVKPKE